MWLTLLFGGGCAKLFPPTSLVEAENLKAEGLEVMTSFVDQLRPQLVLAIRYGGPSNAVEVCAQKAPQIAKEISAETGWDVRRVSLKNRNENAVPDEWERSILETFERAQATGASEDELVASILLKNEFRMMKAQVLQPLCATCHGTSIDEQTVEVLKQYYPNDLAIGYEQGQVRGAISIRKTLP